MGLLPLRGFPLGKPHGSAACGAPERRPVKPGGTWLLSAEVQGVEVGCEAVLLGGLLLEGVTRVAALLLAVPEEPGGHSKG